MSGLFNLTYHTTIALISLFGFLLFAHIAIIGLKAKFSPETHRELRLRIQSWWIILGIVSASLTVHRNGTLLLFAYVSFLALKEFLSLIPTTHQIHRKIFFGTYFTIPIQYYWAYQNHYQLFTAFIPIYLFICLSLMMVMSGITSGFLRTASTLQWAVTTAVFSISHTAYLMNILPISDTNGGPSGLVLYLLALTELNDVAQYIFGKIFGRNFIVPKISPKKTWEGCAGGILTTTTLSAFVAPYLTPLTFLQSIYFGILISVAGFLGDVTMSAIKRDFQIKDTGTTIPGHGGILDRIDSLTFTSPLFFHSFYLFCNG